MEKGIDGVVEYATVSGEFRKRLVVFYYKYIISKYWRTWVQTYREGKLKD